MANRYSYDPSTVDEYAAGALICALTGFANAHGSLHGYFMRSFLVSD